MKTTALVLVLVLTAVFADPLSPADSLLEEAKFQFQIRGDPDRAASVFERVLSEAPADTQAVEMARKGLAFCRKVTGRAQAEAPPGGGGPAYGGAGAAAPLPSLLLWRQTYGEGNITGAGQADSLVALTTEDGLLFLCRATDGEVVWARRGISGLLPPAVAEDAVIVQAKNGVIHALSAAGGKILWSAASGPLTAPLAVLPKRLVIGVSGKRAFALSLQGGAKAWDREFSCENWITHAPVVCGNSVLVRPPGRGIAALSSQNGEIEWQSDIEADLPVLGIDRAVIAVSGASVYALDLKSGKMLWNLNLDRPLMSLSHEEGLGIIALDQAGGVTGLDPATGARRFEFMGRAGRCVASHGRIFIADARGRVLCYSGDGRQVWQFATGETERAEPVMLRAGLAVLTESSGFFMLNPLNNRREDGRLAAGRLEVDMLLKGGMVRSAEQKIRHLISGVAPGDPALTMRYAVLLQSQGKRAEAVATWERYVGCADPGEINDPGVLGRIRDLCGSRWTAYAEAAGKFSPVYRAGGRIAVLGQGEAVVLDGESGEKLWRYRLRSPEVAFQTAAVDGDRLYCAGGDELYGLDLVRQREVWRVPLRANVTQIASREGRLAVGTWNDGCIFVKAATGQTEQRALAGLKALFPFASDNGFYCVSLEGAVARLSGLEVVDEMRVGGRISSLPVLSAGLLVLQTSEGLCKVLSARTGRETLGFRTGSPLSAVAADGEGLYMVISNQVCGALRLPDGRKIWQKREDEGLYEGIACSGGGLAVYGGNRVILCSAGTGETLRTFQIVGRVSAVIFEEGILIVRAENGLLYRFEARP